MTKHQQGIFHHQVGYFTIDIDILQTITESKIHPELDKNVFE